MKEMCEMNKTNLIYIKKKIRTKQGVILYYATTAVPITEVEQVT